MTNERLIDRLVTDLRPVGPRRPGLDAVILLTLFALELAAFLASGAMRPDMPAAMAAPSFWWKLASLGLIAAIGGVVAILSFDPIHSPRPGLRALAAIAGLCLAAGWMLDAAREGWPALATRLDWRDGLHCVVEMVMLSVPPVIAQGLLMRRGAATDRGGTALTVGLASAAWGAFIFVFACPNDDPLYIAVWYVLGCGIVTGLARLALPRLTRW